MLCRGLGGNQLTGTVPKSISSMNKLTILCVVVMVGVVVMVQVALVVLGWCVTTTTLLIRVWRPC